ncbi:hypothetical protein OQA88_1809 [Cercophora sp. LCS_1]
MTATHGPVGCTLRGARVTNVQAGRALRGGGRCASLHDIVSHLCRYAAVDKQYEKDEAIKEYDSILNQAGRSMGQEAWFASWTAAYNTVKLVAPEEVAGIRGIRRFLDAASKYNAGYCAIAAIKAEEDKTITVEKRQKISYTRPKSCATRPLQVSAPAPTTTTGSSATCFRIRIGTARKLEMAAFAASLLTNQWTVTPPDRFLLVNKVNSKRLDDTKKNLEKSGWLRN